MDLDIDLNLNDEFDSAPDAGMDFEVAADLDTSAPDDNLSSIEKASEIPSLDLDVPSISAEDLDDSDGPSLEDLDLGDEVETKLDLAKAYMDMGDNQGAKDILLEVVAEGNDSQKEEGQTLLDKIG